MKLKMLAAASLMCAAGLVDVRAGELECTELASGEVLCDDGSQMFYRPAGWSSFVALNDYQRQRIMDYVGSPALGFVAVNPAGAPRTTHVGSGPSSTGNRTCVSASFPRETFLGSGC